jgi:hypothetical protein
MKIILNNLLYEIFDTYIIYLKDFNILSAFIFSRFIKETIDIQVINFLLHT